MTPLASPVGDPGFPVIRCFWSGCAFSRVEKNRGLEQCTGKRTICWPACVARVETKVNKVTQG